MNAYDTHKDIPGNPSTAKSSELRLNQRIDNSKLKSLTESQWSFWKENGYVIVKEAISKKQA